MGNENSFKWGEVCILMNEITRILTKIDKRQGYNWTWTIVKFSLQDINNNNISVYSQQRNRRRTMDV
jgi:hypothetical protein